MASNGEPPVAAVGCSDVGRSNAVPRHIKPERGQVPDHDSEDVAPVKSENSGHVLDQDVGGLNFANDSSELGPESSLRMSEASAKPCPRDALARESADNPVDPCEVVRADGPDIIVDGALGPAAGEELATVGLALDEPGVLDAGLVEPCVEQAGS